MSIWTRISDALAALTSGEGLSAVFDRLRTPPERSVAFTIAVIALGAKMAKADGLVTRDEVTAFREVFQIAQSDEAGAARVFNLARQDVAGFEEYANRIKRMFGDETEHAVRPDGGAVSHRHGRRGLSSQRGCVSGAGGGHLWPAGRATS